VQSSHSYTAEEALDKHLIDLIANNDAQLLAALDGRTITRMDGTKQTLHLGGAQIVVVQPTLRERLLGWLVESEHRDAAAGGRGAADLSGIQLAGDDCSGCAGHADGAAGDFWAGLLPIRYTAVLLLVAALVLMLLEAKFGGHGVLAIAGILCLTFGMLTLVAAPVPEMGISPIVALGVSVAFGLITVMLVRLAVRARHMKSRLGVDALVGAGAKAMEPLTPEGHVLVEGRFGSGGQRTVAAGDSCGDGA
jgi:membrane-bound serine protease (ClpP class)